MEFDTKRYMTNCIIRVLRSACTMENQFQRHQDIAEAVVIAAKKGEWEAWQYLIQLCSDAESGKYAQRNSTPADVDDPIPVLPTVFVEKDGRVIVAWR